MPEKLLEAIALALGQLGFQLELLFLAWARTLPAVILVPAFGLRGIPRPARAALGLALAAGVLPALRPVESAGPMVWRLGQELLKGLPVAITAASVLWAATMAGGVVDNLRGGRETATLPTVEPGATPMGTLLSLLVSLAFLLSGGPLRLVAALQRAEDVSEVPLARSVATLVSGIELAVAVAAPVIAASILVEVAGALVTRAASPAFLQSLVASFRSLALLAVAGLLLERMLELLVLYTTQTP